MKAVVLEDESGRFPNTPSFKCQSILVFDDCGNTGESKLQIDHVNASQVDIATIEKSLDGDIVPVQVRLRAPETTEIEPELYIRKRVCGFYR